MRYLVQERCEAARVSRQWFRIRDTDGVGVAPGIDALAIAIAVRIDRIHEDEVRRHQVR
jgi:uncharacterized protein YxjI